MIVRNIHDKEVLDTTYIAHGGAIAQMILDRRRLKEIGFLAIVTASRAGSSKPMSIPWRKSISWSPVQGLCG